MTFLRTNAIQFVALDDSVPAACRKDYHDLILRAAETDAADFKLIGQFPVERAGNWQTNGVKLYRLRTD